MKAAEAKFQPVYAGFMKQDIATVAANPEARAIGKNLFLTYCSQCHGSDAAGAKGFPNLTDHDWLYGGEPDTIKATLTDGRAGVMPALGAALGEQGTKEVANYVLSLSGRKHDAALAAAGRPKFAENCAACHTPEGTGMHAMGAPNLTDKVWLYGGSEATIIETINKGRNGVMPAMAQTLGTTSNKDAKLHLLAAYVYGLGGGVVEHGDVGNLRRAGIDGREPGCIGLDQGDVGHDRAGAVEAVRRIQQRGQQRAQVAGRPPAFRNCTASPKNSVRCPADQRCW